MTMSTLVTTWVNLLKKVDVKETKVIRDTNQALTAVTVLVATEVLHHLLCHHHHLRGPVAMAPGPHLKNHHNVKKGDRVFATCSRRSPMMALLLMLRKIH